MFGLKEKNWKTIFSHVYFLGNCVKSTRKRISKIEDLLSVSQRQTKLKELQRPLAGEFGSAVEPLDLADCASGC